MLLSSELFRKKRGTHEKIFVCNAMEGITYAFDNGQILNYQNNFKYLGDLPFTVYFDFHPTM